MAPPENGPALGRANDRDAMGTSAPVSLGGLTAALVVEKAPAGAGEYAGN